MIELYPCANKEELFKRERFYIETIVCVNKCIPTQTIKEWREKNRDQIRQQQKEYYDTNKDQLSQQQKEYYDTNKDVINQRNKRYNVKNKDKINEHLRQKVLCDCGATYSLGQKSKHLKSITHHQCFILSM